MKQKRKEKKEGKLVDTQILSMKPSRSIDTSLFN